MKKLHLGCGSDIKEGFINVDERPYNNKVIAVQLNKNLPFKDDSIDYVYSKYVMEHIIHLEKLMIELHRICKKDSIIEIITPHRSSATADTIGHIGERFGYDKFQAYTNNETEFKGYPYYFDVVEQKITFNAGWNPMNYIGRIFTMNNWLMKQYEETFLHNIFTAKDIYYKLRVVK